MNKEDYKKAQQAGEVEEVEQDKPQEQPQKQEDTTQKFDFAPFLEQIKTIRKPVDTAPTFTPRGFLDQFQFYENGGTRRLYVYISPTWRYVALT